MSKQPIFDSKGNELKSGDKVMLICGVTGEYVDIVEKDGELYLLPLQSAPYPLKIAVERDDVFLERLDTV